jgi:fatty acid desaturase
MPRLVLFGLAFHFIAIRLKLHWRPSSLPHLPLHRHYTVQIYHLSRGSALFKHERANNTVSVLAVFFADLTTTAIGLLTFIPGTAIAYFMAGFPNSTFPFIMLIFWVVSLVLPCCETFELIFMLPYSLFVAYCKQCLLYFTDCFNC